MGTLLAPEGRLYVVVVWDHVARDYHHVAVYLRREEAERAQESFLAQTFDAALFTIPVPGLTDKA